MQDTGREAATGVARAGKAQAGADSLADPLGGGLSDPLMLQADGGSVGGDAPHDAAREGVRGAGGRLPHLDRIQSSFGRHDVSGVRAHSDAQAGEAARSMGASAFTFGDDVGLTGGADLHTVAHEAAHVIQQQGGVQLKGGVGEQGDVYERHADAVADKVVAGQSAEGLLDDVAGSAGAGQPALQLKDDKVAMNWEQDHTSQEVNNIRDGVKQIYDTARQNKTQARNQLDQDFNTATTGLKEKIKYLEIKIKAGVVVPLNQAWNGTKGGDLGLTAPRQRDVQKAATDVTNKVGQVNAQGILAGLDQKALADAQTVVQSESPKIATWVGDNKSFRESIYKEIRPYAQHGVSDPIVEDYETGYLNSGLDITAIKLQWSQYVGQQTVGGQPVSLQYSSTKDRTDVELVLGDDVPDVKIATLYQDDQRFVLSSTVRLPNMEDRQVFKHRESNKEYVQDVEGVFLPRHIKRALNKYDNPEDGSGVSIKSDGRNRSGDNKPWSEVADEVPDMSTEDRDDEIFKHQRQKEAQGGSPFVSMTTTKHDIFGSTATKFESDNGVASIDLAQIPRNKVIDTHNPKAYERITGVKTPNPSMPFAQTEQFSKNVAARDAMRTREVVIAGDVPDTAITGVNVRGTQYNKDLGSGKFRPPGVI